MRPQDGSQPDLRNRGIAFQAVGFAAVLIVSAAILFKFAGSDHWAFRIFEICVTKLYWALAIALAVVFDKVREMFETRGEIRRRIFEEGRTRERRDIRGNMERAGLPLDVIDSIINDGRRQPLDDGIDPKIKRYIDERLAERDN